MSVFRFVAISDIHCVEHDAWPNGAFPKLRGAFDFHEGQENAPDAYIFPGDTVYQLDEDGGPVCKRLHPRAYERFFELLNEKIPHTPRFFVMGNHEYPQSNPDPEMAKECRKMFEHYCGQGFNSHKVINGYHFIGASAWAYSIPQSDENEAFIRTETEKAIAEDADKPVFIILHSPVMRFVRKKGKAPYSDEFCAWLKRTPQAVVITGHTHEPNEDDHCIRRDGYTEINVPVFSIGAAELAQNAPSFQNDIGDVFEISETVLFEVEGSRVVATSYDWGNKVAVNRFAFDVADGGKAGAPHTKEEQEGRTPPEFAPDATVTVEDDGILIKQGFMPYPYCIQYYTLVLRHMESGEETVVSYPTDYYNRTMAAYAKKPLPSLRAGDYTGSLYVCNSFATPCTKPLTFTIRQG